MTFYLDFIQIFLLLFPLYLFPLFSIVRFTWWPQIEIGFCFFQILFIDLSFWETHQVPPGGLGTWNRLNHSEIAKGPPGGTWCHIVEVWSDAVLTSRFILDIRIGAEINFQIFFVSIYSAARACVNTRIRTGILWNCQKSGGRKRLPCRRFECN